MPFRRALQLYSVREAAAADLEGTIRRVAELGFDGVELAGLHGHAAEEVRSWLDEAGLTAPSMHVALEAIEADPAAVATEARVLGAELVAIAWAEPQTDVAGAQAMADRLAAAVRAGREAGIEVAFHNHAPELQLLPDGSTLLDRLTAAVPDVPIELDLGWAWQVDEDLEPLLRELDGRIPIVHLKDFGGRGEPPQFRTLGEGAIDFARALPALEAAGTRWLVAEQDHGFEPDELGAAARAGRALAGLSRDTRARSAVETPEDLGRLAAATSVSPELSVRRGREAIAFYEAAFAAVELYRVGGTDTHEEVVAQLRVGNAAFWVSDESPAHGNLSPESLGGGTTVRLLLVVPDPDAVVERAVGLGATETAAVHEEHRWRLGRIVDPFGHHWEIGRPLIDWPPAHGTHGSG